MRLSRLRLLAAMLVLAGCGDSTSPGTAARLAFTVQPTTTSATGSFSVTVTIRDVLGHVVTNATNDVTLGIGFNAGAGTLEGATPTTIAANNGVAVFDGMQIVKAATGYTLTATSPGLSAATSTPFNITPGAPDSLAFTIQPASTPFGTAIPGFQVAVKDAEGNTVTSDTVPVTVVLASGPGTLSGKTTVNTASGAATFFGLAVNRAGNGYQLLATAPGLGSVFSANFDVTIPFRSVSAGDLYTCGIATSGAAYCWGQNTVGQLGIGVTGGDQARPVPVAGGLKFSIMSAGERHGCGITTARAAYCWGSDSAGALGHGAGSGVDSLPVPVSGGLTFVSLTATGAGFTCGVASQNAAYCWGDNAAGQLGDSSTTDRATPVPVSGGLLFATVSAGGGPNACGVTRSNVADCWGDNSFGQLGTGTRTASTTPIAVSGGLSFASVSARNGHVCGLTTSGQAYCWGRNAEGELGDSVSGGPEQCVVGGTSYACSSAPVPVAGGLVFTTLTTGWFHTCALTRSGAAWCWGDNARGQLGDGSLSGSSVVPVPVSGGRTFIAISAGSLHTCAVTSVGEAFCWGDGASGELGNGQQGAGYFSNVPVAVTP